MNLSERRFYNTYVRPIHNGSVLKLLFFLALEHGPGEKEFALSYRELAERVGLNRSTLVHAVRRLQALPGRGAPPVLERLHRGRGRRPSVYAVHLPGLTCA